MRKILVGLVACAGTVLGSHQQSNFLSNESVKQRLQEDDYPKIKIPEEYQLNNLRMTNSAPKVGFKPEYSQVELASCGLNKYLSTSTFLPGKDHPKGGVSATFWDYNKEIMITYTSATDNAEAKCEIGPLKNKGNAEGKTGPTSVREIIGFWFSNYTYKGIAKPSMDPNSRCGNNNSECLYHVIEGSASNQKTKLYYYHQDTQNLMYEEEF